jgi:polyisoprenoid-binding protein YceI
MMDRARQGLPVLAALAGLVSLLALSVPGDPGARLSWSPGAVAFAQGAPLRYAVVAEQSEVRYRVREQLVGLSLPNDAVGATSAIDGAIVLDPQGRVVPGASRFAVDLRTLRSDEARRDNYLRRRTLETDRYPHVVLVPTEVRGLPSPLPETGTARFELVGELTVRDATRRTTWDAAATFHGPDVRVQARTAFRFAEFGLPVPRVSVVLSVEDPIRLEADLVLRRG